MDQEKTVPRVLIMGGAGTMGSGIALMYAAKGFPTTIVDRESALLEQALQRISANGEMLVREGLLSEEEARAISLNLSCATEDDLAQIAPEADFVVESVFENPDVKRAVYQTLDRFCRADCIFCSNTSGSNIFEIASISHPERFLITHWFNPPFVMGVVEVVMGPETSEETLETVKQVLAVLGKKAAVIRQYIPGFIVNRLMNALMREVAYMVEQGVTTPEDIDEAMRSVNGIRFAFEGPVALYDVVGWDLIQSVAVDLHTSLANDTEGGNHLAARYIKEGRLGLKSGRGAYDYSSINSKEYMEERAKKIIKMMRFVKSL